MPPGRPVAPPASGLQWLAPASQRRGGRPAVRRRRRQARPAGWLLPRPMLPSSHAPLLQRPLPHGSAAGAAHLRRGGGTAQGKPDGLCLAVGQARHRQVELAPLADSCHQQQEGQWGAHHPEGQRHQALDQGGHGSSGAGGVAAREQAAAATAARCWLGRAREVRVRGGSRRSMSGGWGYRSERGSTNTRNVAARRAEAEAFVGPSSLSKLHLRLRTHRNPRPLRQWRRAAGWTRVLRRSRGCTSCQR